MFFKEKWIILISVHTSFDNSDCSRCFKNWLFIILFNNPDWGSAISLQTNLTTESSYVIILNGNLNHGDLPPGEALLSGPYIIEFSIDTPSSNIDFNLNLISNENDHVKYYNKIILNYTIEETFIELGDLNQDSMISILDIVFLVNIILFLSMGHF